MPGDRELARYVEPPLPEARVHRLWTGVETRLRAGPRRPRWRFAAVVATVAVVATGAALIGPRVSNAPMTASAWQNAKLVTGSDAMDVALDDGSRIRLDSSTALQVTESETRSVRLRLQHGRVLCDVKHEPERAFHVHAAGVDVRVVGTRFSVAVDDTALETKVQVHVERGAVEVRSPNKPDQVRRLTAGETWSITTRKQIEPLPESAPAASAPAPTGAVALPEPASPPTPVTSGAAPRGPNGANEVEPTVETGSAKQLLELAGDARRAGHAERAAAAYEALLRRFPGDSRAGLAAFELGRLRMDRLGDNAGAVQALSRAIQLAPGSGMQEDALARLTQLYERLGRSAECRRTRQHYIDRYPNGVHLAAIRQRCASH